ALTGTPAEAPESGSSLAFTPSVACSRGSSGTSCTVTGTGTCGADRTAMGITQLLQIRCTVGPDSTWLAEGRRSTAVVEELTRADCVCGAAASVLEKALRMFDPNDPNNCSSSEVMVV